MSDYAVTSKMLIQFRDEWNRGEDRLSCWDGLDSRAGPMLPFLIRKEWFDRVPFEELNLPRIKAEELSPKPGEMWVLFCLLESDETPKSNSPLRLDGFPLILEWRKGVRDSPLLSAAFHDLAILVRRQQGMEGWGLCPSYSRYGDNVDFTDPALFADHGDAMYVASAYGALAAGLICAISGRHPSRWPFPTLQWDSAHHTIAGVMGLERKLSVAADFGAKVVTVVAEQADAASKALSVLRRGADGKRYEGLRICGVSGRGGPRATARRIAYIESKVRRTVVSALAALLPLLLLLGIGIWDANRVKVVCYADYVERRGRVEGRFPVPNGKGSCFQLYYRGYDTLNLFSRRRILREAWCVDSHGRRCPDRTDLPGHRMVAGRRFSYDEGGRLRETHYLNENGLLLDISRYSGIGNEVIDVYGVDLNQVAEARELTFKADGESHNPSIRRLVYEYDDRGFVIRETYQRDMSGGSVQSASGICETRFLRDDIGRIVEASYWGKDGKAIADGHGFQRRSYAYDGSRLRLVKCFDVGGRCSEQMEYRNGGRYRLSVWQLDGGCDSHCYDEEGRCVRVEYRDCKGGLIEDSDGVSVVRYEYDENGGVCEKMYDRNGREVTNGH